MLKLYCKAYLHTKIRYIMSTYAIRFSQFNRFSEVDIFIKRNFVKLK